MSAGLAPLLLAGGWAVAALFQSPSYSPVRQSISVLAGYGAADRWIMTACLLGIACSQLVTAAGLTGLRRPARIVLAATGVAGLGVALFPEPLHGSTVAHIAASVIGAILMTCWPLFVGSRQWGHHLVLGVSGSLATAAIFGALLVWLLAATQTGVDLGAAERTVTGVEVTWPLAVVLALRHATAAVGGPDASPLPAVDRSYGRAS